RGSVAADRRARGQGRRKEEKEGGAEEEGCRRYETQNRNGQENCQKENRKTKRAGSRGIELRPGTLPRTPLRSTRRGCWKRWHRSPAPPSATSRACWASKAPTASP